MPRHFGYVGTALSIEATTDRTCRLRNATPELLRHLIGENLLGLERVLRFNLQQSIFLYRISSHIIPFASHPANTVPWWDEYGSQLEALGEFIARHRMRVSMHPGQFTVLNSPDDDIVAASRLELQWHVRFLDCLGTSEASKVVLHVGGGYGARAEAVERFVRSVDGVPESWRRRLAIENDERIFSAENVLEIARRTGLPVIFDWLHHQSNPGPTLDTTRLLGDCFDSWRAAEGPPEVHLSSQATGGRRGQHADWVDPEDFLGLSRAAPRRQFDCMLEAKRRDQALLRLRGELRARGIFERGAA